MPTPGYGSRLGRGRAAAAEVDVTLANHALLILAKGTSSQGETSSRMFILLVAQLCLTLLRPHGL